MPFKLPDTITSSLETYAASVGVSNAQLSAALGLGSVLAGVWVYTFSASSVYHGPGPKGLPIIGSALDMPTSHEYKVYGDWAKKYGAPECVRSNLLA